MIISPTRILWPTDFSPLSLKAAEYARGFRGVFGAELRIVHVCPPFTSPMLDLPVPADAGLAVNQAQLLAAVRNQLQRLAGELFGPDSNVRYDALVGNPWQEVCGYARDNAVDLIVVATHGRTGLPHVLMGSVAERIVQHAHCPVLVVKSVERDFTVGQA